MAGQRGCGDESEARRRGRRWRVREKSAKKSGTTWEATHNTTDRVAAAFPQNQTKRVEEKGKEQSVASTTGGGAAETRLVIKNTVSLLRLDRALAVAKTERKPQIERVEVLQ